MLVIHHIIDALRGKSKKYQTMSLPGVTEQKCSDMATLLNDAEKFDFGTLVLEKKPESDEWLLPKLTKDELQFWCQDLIPLPAPACWFEFTINNSRSGVFVVEDGDRWLINRIDFCPPDVLFDAVVVSINKLNVAEEKDIDIFLHGNQSMIDAMRDNDLWKRASVASSAPMALYLTLMLNSKTTEILPEAAPKTLNKARAKKGKALLAAHRIVTIVPSRYQHESENEGRSLRRPPRLHWRRSHKRHFDHHVPSAIWAPEEQHRDRKGWWVAVIPRCLVSRAELGEVSHEYRVIV